VIGPNVRLPLGPLLAVMPMGRPGLSEWQTAGTSTITSLPPKLERAWYRSKQQGWITLYMADQVCCALGKHPAEVYGAEWWAAQDVMV
jgi:hypothetical protein